ncbi:ATP-grasp domain-containing protein [Dactylosporangium sp. NPDC051485]|uniref:ATP-grasp domain-containing protein n=1 Tax=Dactylosporangium sp. NPDC051485 TaxID=3154846 RepID=UPI00341C3A49
MLLTEVQGKRLLREARVPVPDGREISHPAQLADWTPTFPVAVKAQVAAGGRGLAGGVRKCTTGDEVNAATTALLNMSFGGERAGSVLVEQWLDIRRELYLSVVVDAAAGGYVVLYSPRGGVHVEDETQTRVRYDVGLPRNFRAYTFRDILSLVEPDRAVRERVVAIARRLLELCASRHCTTLELNPLVVLGDGQLVAADAKAVVDDAAQFKSEWIRDLLVQDIDGQPEDVQRCLRGGLSVVWLGGSVGLVSSGAGMTMAVMDELDAWGGRAACFLDVSGNPTPDGFALAIDLLAASPQVDAVLISIFGGGMHVDRVASTLLDVLSRKPVGKPVVIRLGGTGSEVATRLLERAGLFNHETLEDAVRDVVNVTGVAV